jgi:hypothetical protein
MYVDVVATSGPIETKSQPDKELLKVSELDAAMATCDLFKDRLR